MIKPFYEWCYRRQCIPDSNDFLVSESPDGVKFSLSDKVKSTLEAGTAFPLKLVKVSSTSFKVLAGEVSGFAIAETTYTSITTSKSVWVSVTQGYSTSTGVWTPSAAALGTPATSYATPDATHQIVQLGTVTCSGGVITVVSPQVSGSQYAKREGPASGYVDENRLV